MDNVDLAPGVSADLDRRGRVLGIEVLPSSRHLRPFLAGLASHPRGLGCNDRDRGVSAAVGTPRSPSQARRDHAQGRGSRNHGTPGLPPVTARPGFAEKWAAVRAELEAERISRAEAARRMKCGYATLLRLLRVSDSALQRS